MSNRTSRTRAFTAIALLLWSAPASAFQFNADPVQNNQPVSECPMNDGVVFYRFTPDSDPQAVPFAREGFAQWNGLKNIANFSLTSVSEVPPGSTNVSPYTVAVTVKNEQP